MDEATEFVLRDMIAGEADALGRVMFRAIREGPSAYTEAQRIAWCAAPHAGDGWAWKLAAQDVVVAEAHGAPVGFITRQGAYVDLAFVVPEWQGRGVFSALYSRTEADALAAGQHRLWVHASLIAQPAFAARGFRVSRREAVHRAGEALERAEMEKSLAVLT
ncbi:GNAT family N-acetyltransferase [Tateyamaria omphalii]|uniref:GNAT family N-acetyltransferase n=1 Tax=Tateyamaria omphalii TaxID=299262 RepID=UPI001C990F03|nr:GNAT family N-acetyltransferase [Tateyamaria omphalii]MBY5935380.1 GNAT family N-acetyltransferase [Tateyamaria omphalii]